VQQIVTKYGGIIDVVSDGGTGTTFSVQFPVADQT
jgi:signal transduction histidine kinase